MTAPDTTPPASAPTPTWRESLAVYLQPRVLIVLMLGFSSGLPLALSGSTLLVWMRESGVDLPFFPAIVGNGAASFSLDASHTVPIGQYVESATGDGGAEP